MSARNAAPAPFARSKSGTCAWQVPGQDGRHLVWREPGQVWLCAGPARAAHGTLVIGPYLNPVSGPLSTIEDAKRAVGARLAAQASS